MLGDPEINTIDQMAQAKGQGHQPMGEGDIVRQSGHEAPAEDEEGGSGDEGETKPADSAGHEETGRVESQSITAHPRGGEQERGIGRGGLREQRPNGEGRAEAQRGHHQAHHHQAKQPLPDLHTTTPAVRIRHSGGRPAGRPAPPGARHQRRLLGDDTIPHRTAFRQAS